MSTLTPTTESPAEARARLRAELARPRRRLRLQLALEILAETAAAVVALGAPLVALDWLLRPGLPARGALLTVAVVALAAFLAARAARRWTAARLDDLTLAMTLDRLRPGLGQQIADVLQLPDLLDDHDGSTSPAMVRRAVRQAVEALDASDWKRLWNRRRTAAHVALGLAALAVPAAFAAIAPAAARLSLARWLQGSDERWPQSTYLSVMNLDPRGRLIAPRDERAAVEVRSDLPLIEHIGDRWLVGGRGPAPLPLRREPKSSRAPDVLAVRESAPKTPTRSANMTETSPGRFQYEFPPASDSSTFDLAGGDDWLGPIVLERVDRPALATTRLRAREPGSADPDFRDVEDAPSRSAFLPDSEIELTLEGTQDLSAAKIAANPGASPTPERIGPRTFRTRWTLKEAVTFEIVVTSSETGLTSKPTFLTVGIQRDREPRVTLRAAGVGARVTAAATIPLTLAATDDLGLDAIRIRAERTAVASESDKPERKGGKTEIPIPFEPDPARPTLDFQARHDVLLQADPPADGTVLRFVAEADDRCARGAQTGRSGVVAFTVVPPDELFYEILVRQRAERAKFLAVVEAAEKRTPALEAAPGPKPEDVVAMSRAVRSEARQVDQIAGRIADALLEMKLNQIGSPKSLRLLQEGVVDPLRALAAEPMPKLQSTLQTLAAAGAAGPAGDEARRRHAEVVTTMRRILEQMSQWESFVDVVNQVAEVIEMQRQVLQKTERARETRAREVFDDKP